MPIPIFFHVLDEGTDSISWFLPALKVTPWLAIIFALKIYFGGAVNKSERLMHGKVVMITGGTSGIGATVVERLASRGAQVILLVRNAIDDPFLQEYIEDVREKTRNEMIYAETVNLSSLHSIRRFATKWVDNAPPRRLDMIILCASTFRTYFGSSGLTLDGVEECWGMNYLANFQLLSILSPALRAQPADRDVRVIFATCGSYVGGELRQMENTQNPLPKNLEYETSKLALMTFAQAFQRHLDAYKRPDKLPMNSRVIMVDPGWVRTPGMQRWLSLGSLWGLAIYVALYPIFWLFLKSPSQGAQSFLKAAMEADYGRGQGGRLVRECVDWKAKRPEIYDEKVQRELWEYTEKHIIEVEKSSASKRSKANSDDKRMLREKDNPKHEPRAQKSEQSVSRRSKKSLDR